MNIAGFIPDATNAYKGMTFEIFVSGCTNECKGCHNPELQDFAYGEEYDVDKLLTKIEEYRGWFDMISWLGGDLLDQPDAEEYARAVKNMYFHTPMILFTGKEKNQIPDWCYEIFDCIKYGPYVEELKQEGFPSSSNQGVIVINNRGCFSE